MADDYDVRAKHFITKAGRIRSRSEMRQEVAKITDHLKKEARRLAQAQAAGRITANELETEMRSLLKASHTLAASIGRGGWKRMTPKDWGRVGAKIKWQNKYLKKFARIIARDILSGPAAMNRIQSYASAIHVTFYRAFAEEMRETGTMPSDVPRDKDGKEILVKLVQNSEEGCPDCIADADEGFMPLDEMGDLGTRECGDWCKCILVFSDE